MKFKNVIALSLLGICGGSITTSINNNYVYASSKKDD